MLPRTGQLTRAGALIALLFTLSLTGLASSHMDAPLISKDPAANLTDVYAFVTMDGDQKYLTTALSVWPFEEPGIGPNLYGFDDNVTYSIHIEAGNDVLGGKDTIEYQFRFDTEFKNPDTAFPFLQPIEASGDANQNYVQTYTVTKLVKTKKKAKGTVLGTGVVPPNNQGCTTPKYNVDEDGKNPAKDGDDEDDPADYISEDQKSLTFTTAGYGFFAGQRDDAFFGDVLAVFDGAKLRDPGEDMQQGFNVHSIVLRIPVDELGGDQQVVGVWATTSRPKKTVIKNGVPIAKGKPVQVGRLGNPLFNEVLMPLGLKDAYNSDPRFDADRVALDRVTDPEVAELLNILYGMSPPVVETDRTDLVEIFIPDEIKVDLSTGPARLAGGGPNHPTNPDDEGFSSLSIFGSDVLQSQIQDPFANGGFIPGGWPNGRRFGDDVIDIALSAVVSDLRDPRVPFIRTLGDGVDANDAVFFKTFPYAANPHNGRNHLHHPCDKEGSTGGGEDDCVEIAGFGQVPDYTAAYFFTDLNDNTVTALVPGGTYVLQGTVFKEASAPAGPVDIIVEVFIENDLLLKEQIQGLDKFLPIGPVTVMIPEDTKGCIEVLFDEMLDTRMRFPLDTTK